LTEKINFEELFSVPKEFWLEECDIIRHYFTEQVGSDMPDEIWNQLEQEFKRLNGVSSQK
jgi:phosphoenolpyruvate carboxykinase (GTP)